MFVGLAFMALFAVWIVFVFIRSIFKGVAIGRARNREQDMKDRLEALEKELKEKNSNS